MAETGTGATGRGSAVRAFLAANSFFGGMSEPHLDRLAALGRVRRCAAGESLFFQDDPGDSLIVILSGTVKIARIGDDGRETVLNFLGPGDVLGEIAVLDGGARSASAGMIAAGEVFVILRRDLMPALEASPGALLELVAVLCEKLRAASEAAEASRRGMGHRFAAGLLRLAGQHGRRTAEGIEIRLSASQQDLGTYLGLSRENASREIARLSRAGVLSASRGRIVILDMEGLERALDEPEG